jgi:hypothetical protein
MIQFMHWGVPHESRQNAIRAAERLVLKIDSVLGLIRAAFDHCVREYST